MINIRKYNKEDLEVLVNLWFGVSLKAHDFISKEYWRAQKSAMKEKYLPLSDTYIIEDSQNIFGFISMVDTYLAAIFIDNNSQGRGYGKNLLQYVKGQKQHIELKVYKKNEASCEFYLKNGFMVMEETLDEATGEKEYLMMWNKEFDNKMNSNSVMKTTCINNK
ncbi:N-acetyltransferase [Clostridium sp.]|uniref:N-acetyltransferase n=1 Tax=Clostridium sp. TaxID=1506 RepID=UPI002FC87FE2